MKSSENLKKSLYFVTICQDLIEFIYFQSENFLKDLFIMERVVNLNTYQPKQALYRGFDIVAGNIMFYLQSNQKVLLFESAHYFKHTQ